VLPGTVVAEQEPLFISLGGPKAHDFSNRDDKGEGSASFDSSCGKDFCLATTLSGSAFSLLCHLDRSAAQWRDLRFSGSFLEMFFFAQYSHTLFSPCLSCPLSNFSALMSVFRVLTQTL
jgi:hypothetical protein